VRAGATTRALTPRRRTADRRWRAATVSLLACSGERAVAAGRMTAGACGAGARAGGAVSVAAVSVGGTTGSGARSAGGGSTMT
jgi:hypothetical protein